MPTSKESRIAPARPVGIIAGSGMLPLALMRKCESIGVPVVVAALNGYANVDDYVPHVRTSVPIGRGKRMVNFFREHGVQDIVLIGAVQRPSFWDVRPDFWTLVRIGPILLRGGLGDDGLLRAVRRIFEAEGFHIRGIQTYLPDLIAGTGAIGRYAPQEQDMHDIQRGLDAARTLGRLDIGQSVVVQGGIILGVEAAEGTSALIKRCGDMKRAGPGPILIKSSKPQQDEDMDLPTIGPDTLQAAMMAGYRGIVVEAGRTLIVQPVRIAEMADAAQFFVYGST